jgi:transcriptional regulator with XRE-family HTH domain
MTRPLHEHLAEVREAADLTQTALSRVAVLDRASVNRIEQGLTTPTLPTLEAWAKACGRELRIELAVPGSTSGKGGSDGTLPLEVQRALGAIRGADEGEALSLARVVLAAQKARPWHDVLVQIAELGVGAPPARPVSWDRVRDVAVDIRRALTLLTHQKQFAADHRDDGDGFLGGDVAFDDILERWKVLESEVQGGGDWLSEETVGRLQARLEHLLRLCREHLDIVNRIVRERRNNAEGGDIIAAFPGEEHSALRDAARLLDYIEEVNEQLAQLSEDVGLGGQDEASEWEELMAMAARLKSLMALPSARADKRMERLVAQLQLVADDLTKLLDSQFPAEKKAGGGGGGYGGGGSAAPGGGGGDDEDIPF